MWVTERRQPKIKRTNQAGGAAVEFALVATVFFTIIFGIIEFARAMYMFNTLPEVTRQAARAAANISFMDEGALNLARKRAVFNETKGELLFGSPITYQNIRIEYMYLPAKGMSLELIPAGGLPSSPARNRLNCLNSLNNANCIRAVQARVCQETTNTGSCTAVTFQSLISLINLPLKLPTSPTIVSAETLGYKPGDAP